MKASLVLVILLTILIIAYTATHPSLGWAEGYDGGSSPDYGEGYPVGDPALDLYPGHGTYPGDFETERGVYENEDVPPGNPYMAGRLSAPWAAAPCVDDEADDDEIDGDERNVYQAFGRNDPTRPTAGTMNRRSDLDPYFREELDEEEDRVWWGRGEL